MPAQPVLTAVFYGYFALRFALTAHRFTALVATTASALLYPAVCLASVLWSLAPMQSLVGALQIAFTILVGLFLGGQFGAHALARMIFAALSLAMLASLANLGGALGVAYSYEDGFLGVFTNKNMLGQRAAILIVTGIYLLIFDRSPAVRLACCFMLPITFYMLGISRSATSIVLTFFAVGGFLSIVTWRHQAALRIPLLLAAGLALALAVTAYAFFAPDVFGALLDAFGKSRTLTGRTLLWEHAVRQIEQAPLLGVGALAYWTAPAFAQETALLQGAYGSTVSAFHNFILEILVMTGPLGLAAMAIFVLVGLNRCLQMTTLDREWAVTIILVLTGLALLGSSLYRPHEISLFLIAALIAASRPLPKT